MGLQRPKINDFDPLSSTEIEAKFEYYLEGTTRWCRTHGLFAERMNCSVCKLNIGSDNTIVNWNQFC